MTAPRGKDFLVVLTETVRKGGLGEEITISISINIS